MISFICLKTLPSSALLPDLNSPPPSMLRGTNWAVIHCFSHCWQWYSTLCSACRLLILPDGMNENCARRCKRKGRAYGTIVTTVEYSTQVAQLAGNFRLRLLCISPCRPGWPGFLLLPLSRFGQSLLSS